MKRQSELSLQMQLLLILTKTSSGASALGLFKKLLTKLLAECLKVIFHQYGQKSPVTGLANVMGSLCRHTISYARIHLYCLNSFWVADTKSWVFPLTWEVTFTTARELNCCEEKQVKLKYINMKWKTTYWTYWHVFNVRLELQVKWPLNIQPNFMQEIKNIIRSSNDVNAFFEVQSSDTQSGMSLGGPPDQLETFSWLFLKQIVGATMTTRWFA